MQKNVFKFILAFGILVLILVILVPYFENHFSRLRAEKEREEEQQKLVREQLAKEKREKEAKEKIYLLGKFEPAQREDFVAVPSEYNIADIKCI